MPRVCSLELAGIKSREVDVEYLWFSEAENKK